MAASGDQGEPFFTSEYVPPPPPEPGRWIVRSTGNKFPTLHLSPDVAMDLWMVLGQILKTEGLL
jgi:hypothetical protein